jgi:sec-independent protein translocase protein TatB
MFDVGFSELLLLAIIGLLVLGPERLPKVARTVGFWAGRARGYVRQMSTELEREVQRSEMQKHIDDAKRILNERVDLDGEKHGQTTRKTQD